MITYEKLDTKSGPTLPPKIMLFTNWNIRYLRTLLLQLQLLRQMVLRRFLKTSLYIVQCKTKGLMALTVTEYHNPKMDLLGTIMCIIRKTNMSTKNVKANMNS